MGVRLECRFPRLWIPSRLTSWGMMKNKNIGPLGFSGALGFRSHWRFSLSSPSASWKRALLSGLTLLGGSPGFESNPASTPGSVWRQLPFGITSFRFCSLSCKSAGITVPVLKCCSESRVQAGKGLSRNGVPFPSLSEPPCVRRPRRRIGHDFS